ncbi:MAG: ferritin family protein [Tissierellales bacterium]
MNDLEMAIQMEKDGEIFYKRQAELNKDNYLFNICMMLAEDEKVHANVLEKKLKSLEYELSPSTFDKEPSLFTNLNDFSVEERFTLRQQDFYSLAADIELKSIELYTRLFNQSEDEKDKEIFQYLIDQEKNHYNIIDALAQALRSADEWVENAEFGNRPEY